MTLAASGNILVLVVHLIVQKRHDQTCSCSSCSAHLALVTPNRVVAEETALSVLVQPAQDRRDVVGEEALLVENGAESLRTGLDAHRLAVLVAVHLDDGVEAFLQRFAVGGKSDHAEHDGGVVLGGCGAADLEDFGGVAGVDVVSAGGTGVAGDDGEVVAGNGEGRTAIVGVAARVG